MGRFPGGVTVTARRGSIPCPHCGEAFPRGRPACPHCGSDAETGWLPADEQDAAGTDLSFTHLDDDAYERFLAEEGLAGSAAARRRGGGSGGRRARQKPRLVLIGAVLLAIAVTLTLILLAA